LATRNQGAYGAICIPIGYTEPCRRGSYECDGKADRQTYRQTNRTIFSNSTL